MSKAPLIPLIEIVSLLDSGDARGASFPLGEEWLRFLGRAVDCHVMTISPGQTRGNHSHLRKREILLITHSDTFTFCWDEGPQTSKERRELTGAGAVMVKVAPGASHAIVNSGSTDLYVTALCNEPYNPLAPDAVPRAVT